MFNLIFTEQYGEDLVELDLHTQKQIDNKIQQLKFRPLLGKRLIGYPYWSLHIGDYRVIYKIDNQKQTIEILTILARKHDYTELGRL